MDKDKVLELIGSMSVLEACQLIKDMEEKFGISEDDLDGYMKSKLGTLKTHGLPFIFGILDNNELSYLSASLKQLFRYFVKYAVVPLTYYKIFRYFAKYTSVPLNILQNI